MYRETFAGCTHVKPVGRLVIDLDLPPELRWEHLRTCGVVKVDELVCSARLYVDETCLGLGLPPLANGTSLCLRWCRGFLFWVLGRLCAWTHPYSADLRAVAQVYRIPLGELYIANLLYELLGGCTSFVCVDGASGKLLHGRTLDWPFIPLGKHTIQMEWVSGGQTLFQSVGWPGYVGVMTAVKPGKFSISLNARYPSVEAAWWAKWLVAKDGEGAVMASLLTSASCRLYSGLLGGGFQAASLIRKTLERADSFDEACTMLHDMPIAVPSYFVVVSTGPDAAIITRGVGTGDRRVDRIGGGEGGRPAFLVQTNDDHPQQGAKVGMQSGAPVDFFSTTRYNLACDMLLATPPDALSRPLLGRLMTKSVKQGGVRMAMTLFMAVLSPAEEDQDRCLVACKASRAVGPRG